MVRWRGRRVAVVLCGAALVAGCSSPADEVTAEAPTTSVPRASTTVVGSDDVPPATGAPPTTPPTTVASVPGAVDARVLLAPLVIDDSPSPGVPYDRDSWDGGGWEDLDGDGCDTRDEVLQAQSSTPAQVDPYRCQVVAGDWVSAYDGLVTEDPGDLQIDHVVALADAHRSGGWSWTPDRRRQFANDETNLIAVSGTSNQSKGSRSPDEWRPPRQESWCAMATTWVTVKVLYGLTATTAERDALGQMLDTCA